MKSKGGAPRGNRNALKSGLHTAQSKRFRLAVRLQIATAKALIREAYAIASGYPASNLEHIEQMGRIADNLARPEPLEPTA
ncbi:MAG TPA: hypothetical protein VHL34_18620 [Rhizomicrobium sp.]|nr:hypothetical protein [Rhizomicrobium sp.]